MLVLVVCSAVVESIGMYPLQVLAAVSMRWGVALGEPGNLAVARGKWEGRSRYLWPELGA